MASVDDKMYYVGSAPVEGIDQEVCALCVVPLPLPAHAQRFFSTLFILIYYYIVAARLITSTYGAPETTTSSNNLCNCVFKCKLCHYRTPWSRLSLFHFLCFSFCFPYFILLDLSSPWTLLPAHWTCIPDVNIEVIQDPGRRTHALTHTRTHAHMHTHAHAFTIAHIYFITSYEWTLPTSHSSFLLLVLAHPSIYEAYDLPIVNRWSRESISVCVVSYLLLSFFFFSPFLLLFRKS